MEYLDSYRIDEANRVDKIIAELRYKYPEINWQTKWNDYEDNNGNPSNNISLVVPFSHYQKAKQLYQELQKSGFEFESSVFDSLIKQIVDFRDERNWEQFHNPKDLAISLSLEASELLENFQWKTSENAINLRMDNIIDELADVVIYALLMANRLDINLEQAIKEKINKNREKYPVDKSFGSSKKYTDL